MAGIRGFWERINVKWPEYKLAERHFKYSLPFPYPAYYCPLSGTQNVEETIAFIRTNLYAVNRMEGPDIFEL